MINSEQNNILIDIKNVSKTFNLPHERNTSIKTSLINIFKKHEGNNSIEKQKVLNGINLEIREGEFFGIVGRNGSGKSTLLKIIAEIYQPSEGRVGVHGKIVPFIELGVGFNPELSGRENVFLNGSLLGFSHSQINDRFKDILDFAELHDFIDQKLKNYSSGMQVRLAFSIATRLSESDILLIDEVLAVGDAKFQRKCFDYFSKLKKQGKTVVFVTHDMNAVRQYCTRAMLIEDSEQIFTGSPEEVATKYTKLFQETAGDDEKAEEAIDSKRYGDKKIEITAIKANKKLYKVSDKEIAVTLTVYAKESFENIVYGISIMNESGQRLFGTNSSILREKPNNLLKNQKTKIQWIIPNIFNEGDYDICPQISLPNGDICDAWDGAVKISVVSDITTPFPVNPLIQFIEN